MYITKLNQQLNLQFKSIQLNNQEYTQSDEIIHSLQSNSKKSDNLKMQLFSDVFQRHIKNEARNKAKNYYFEDVLQEMYLKFFEALNDIENISTEALIEIINKYKPEKKDLKEICRHDIASIYQEDINGNLTIETRLNENRSSTQIKSCSEIDKEKLNSQLTTLEEQSDLTQQKKNILNKIKENKNNQKISEETGLTATWVGKIIFSTIAQIQDTQGILPDVFKNHINAIAMEYSLNEQEKKILKKALISNAILTHKDVNQIINNINKTAKLLNLDKIIYFKSTLKHISLWGQKPETIKNNAINSANLLGIPTEDFIQVALKQCQLFYQKPQKLNQNIDQLSQILNREKAEVIKIAIQEPVLFYMKPETIGNNINNISKELNISKEELIKKFMICPVLFHSKSSTTIKKVKINNYYKIIQNKTNKTVFSTSSDQVLYQKILIYLITKSDNLKKLIPSKNLIQYLQEQNKIYEFQIPENELKEEFIKYVQEFSNNHFQKQIFKII